MSAARASTRHGIRKYPPDGPASEILWISIRPPARVRPPASRVSAVWFSSEGAVPMRARGHGAPSHKEPARTDRVYFGAAPCDFTTVSADAMRLDTSARLAGTIRVLPVLARLPKAST